MTSNSKLIVVSLLLSFIISSCKKEVKKTRIQVLEYKSEIPIKGAGVEFGAIIGTSTTIPNYLHFFGGETDANGYCDVPDGAIAAATLVRFGSPNYYVFSSNYRNFVTVFKLDLIGNVKIHLVDTVGFGMTCRLYIYPERPSSIYYELQGWELRALPEGHIPSDYSFVTQAYGGQINNLQIINDEADTINTFVNVSRTDTTFVEIKY